MAMNDGATASSLQVIEMFPNAEAAREFLEDHRWGGHVHCPTCGKDRVTARKGKRLGYYRCRDCEDEFTVRTGTIFERSHVPLHKWLYAIYLLVAARKGISSMQLSKQLSVTQATAWFMLGRLREAWGGDMGKLAGIVEVDEAYIGGKEKNEHPGKKLNAGRGTVGKQPVLGLRERGTGKSVAMPIEGTNNAALRAQIEKHLEPGSLIHTDEHSSYDNLPGYTRSHVKHGAGEYVGANDIHVNSAGSIWALLNRSVYGTWRHVSVKHLARISHQAACRRQKALGFHEVDRDVDDRADCGLRWPRPPALRAGDPRGSFGPVRARAPSTVVPAMLSVASARSKERVRTGPKSSAIITAPGEKCGLARHVNEATFRLNEGNVKIHTLNRVASFLAVAFNHRITYKRRVGVES